jgi:hypothetical protein
MRTWRQAMRFRSAGTLVASGDHVTSRPGVEAPYGAAKYERLRRAYDSDKVSSSTQNLGADGEPPSAGAAGGLDFALGVRA